jgi:hypothetical protein
VADIPPLLTSGDPNSSTWIWGILVSKVAPAIAGAYVRNLFPPRKPILQRLGEASGGVLLVLYGHKIAAGTLWALLNWALGFVDTKAAEVIQRSDADMLAAFLVGLLGMTIVEGALIVIRRRAAAA